MLNKIKKIRDKMTPEKVTAKKCKECKKIEHPFETEYLHGPDICDCSLKDFIDKGMLSREEKEKIKSKIKEALKRINKLSM